MRIDRIDPHRAEWGPHGTIALATESAGIQFLVPDDATTYASESLRFTRLVFPEESAGQRVLSMAFGPLRLARGGRALLSVVLNTGSLLFLEEQGTAIVCRYRSSDRTFYTSTCWSGEIALVGDELGQIHAVETDVAGDAFVSFAPFAPALSGPVVQLTASCRWTAAGLQDNSCWVYGGTQWTQVVPPGTVKVVSLTLDSEDALLVQRSRDVLVIPQLSNLQSTVQPPTEVPLKSVLPGFLVSAGGSFHVVHTNGCISRSREGISVPTISNSTVSCTARHPTLPLAVVVVGPTYNGWQYPMLSTRVVNVAVYPTDGTVRFRFKLAPFPLSFLAAKLLPQAIEIPNQLPAAVDSLPELYLSSEFDGYRYEWLYGNRETATHKLLTRTLDFLQKSGSSVAPLKDSLDEMVLTWLSDTPLPTEVRTDEKLLLRGDFVTEEFAVQDYFNKSKSTLRSSSGHEWRRCAITGLPLLSVDLRESTDGTATAYTKAPEIVTAENSEQSNGIIGQNSMVQLLLDSAAFSVLSGSLWK